MLACLSRLRARAKDCVTSCMMGLLLVASCNGGGDDETADIRAEIEPNDTLVQAGVILPGQPLLGSVDETSDPSDFFLFTVLASGPRQITLSGFGASDLDLLLYARNGLLLDFSESSGSPEVINRTFSVDNEYVIEVRAVSTPAATAYTLRMDD